LEKKKNTLYELEKKQSKNKTNRLHTTKKISTKNQPVVCKKKKVTTTPVEGESRATKIEQNDCYNSKNRRLQKLSLVGAIQLHHAQLCILMCKKPDPKPIPSFPWSRCQLSHAS